MTPAEPSSTGRTLSLGWSGDGTGPQEPGGTSTGQEPGGTSTGPAAPPGGTRRTRYALLGAIAGLLALVLALPRLLVGGADPEELVREHLDALVARDVPTVREQLDTTQEASDAALTAAILRAAEDRVTGYTIDGVERDGRHATVTATLRFGRASQQATFSVRAESAGPFARADWALDPVPSAVDTVTVPGQAEQLLINGVALPLAELPTESTSHDQKVVSLRLLPGSYALTLPAGGELLEPAVRTLEVPAPGHAQQHAGTVVGYDLSEEGRSRVSAQIDELLQGCAASTSAAPESCPFDAATDPFSGTPIQDDAPGTWEVTPPAAYDISRHVGMTWNIVSTPGQAVFTPDTGADGPGEEHQVPFVLQGTAVLDDSGELRTSIQDSPTTVSWHGCEDESDGGVVDGSETGSSTTISCDEGD